MKIFVLFYFMNRLLRAYCLNQLIKTAVDNNPQLKTQKLEWQRLIHQYKQTTSLSDPTLVYSESLSPIETRLGPQDRVLSAVGRMLLSTERSSARPADVQTTGHFVARLVAGLS